MEDLEGGYKKLKECIGDLNIQRKEMKKLEARYMEKIISLKKEN